MKLHAPDATHADGFTSSASRCVLPLVIWAAHFFGCYASVEVACALRLHHVAIGGVAALSLWLWILTAAAIASLLSLTLAAIRHSRTDQGSGSMQDAVFKGTAILALVGVLWSAIPIALLDGASLCRAARW